MVSGFSYNPRCDSIDSPGYTQSVVWLKYIQVGDTFCPSVIQYSSSKVLIIIRVFSFKKKYLLQKTKKLGATFNFSIIFVKDELIILGLHP